MTFSLRRYQREAIDQIYHWFGQGREAPLIVTPTGSGKSVILAEFVREACMDYPDTHILVTTHVKELVEQDARAIIRSWPDAPIGVYSAGLGARHLDQITVASIQSIYDKSFFVGRFDLVIVDEAHLIPKKSAGMYRKYIDACKEKNPQTKLIGLTATPYRLDSGCLHEGEDRLFDGIAYEANVADLIRDGYLCPLTSKVGGNVDLSSVKTIGGEYNLGQLGERMSAIELVEEHADAIISKCEGRSSLLIFCVTVEHARRMSAALRNRGVLCDYVDGEMENKTRDLRINAFKRGALRALVNCSILTTGFDHPPLDAVVMLRPTLSPGLYVQMVGRGLRLHESKKDCLVLDFGGNVRRHGLIDKVEPPRKGKGKKGAGEAPVKECPACGRYCPIMLRRCECGHEFPPIKRESERMHYIGAILSTELKPVTLNVDRVFYSKHIGKSGLPSLRVDYYCGLRRVSEYIAIEHEGYAREKARRWWVERDGIWPVQSSDHAVMFSQELKVPKSIRVNFGSKWPDILGYEW